MNPNHLTTEQHWIRSQIDHPAGRDHRGPHYDGRLSGCMGERTTSPTRPAQHRAPEPTMFEAVLALVALVAVTVAITVIVVVQAWKSQGFLGLVIVAALAALIVTWWRRTK